MLYLHVNPSRATSLFHSPSRPHQYIASAATPPQSTHLLLPIHLQHSWRQSDKPPRATSTTTDGDPTARAATCLIHAFREDLDRQLPLPLPVGIKYVPALKQYAGQHLTNLVSFLAADMLALGTPGAAVGPSVSRQDDEVPHDERVSRALQDGPTTLVIDDASGAQLQVLLGVLADEVRLRLANQHSKRDVFHPPEVTALVEAYAVLAVQPLQPHIATMLDALAGFVVKRITARHLHAVARPRDILRMLRAYAKLQHRSVAVPELVAALTEELKRQVAASYERVDSASAPQHVGLDVAYVASLLSTLVQLQQLPQDNGLLRAMVTASWRNIGVAPVEACVALLRLLAALRHRPGRVSFLFSTLTDFGLLHCLLEDCDPPTCLGDWWLALLASRLWDATVAGNLAAGTAAACMSDMAAFGYNPPAGWVAATMAALTDGDEVLDDDEMGVSLLQTACVACTVGCIGQQDAAMVKAIAHAAQQGGACLSLEPAVVEAASAAVDARGRGVEVSPWVRDVCSVLVETLHCTRCRLTAQLGPSGSRLHVVEWQSTGAIRVDAPGSVPENDSSGFGFISSDQEPLEAVPGDVQVMLQGSGVCVLVDASELSSNEPHVLSVWAVAMLNRVQAQRGAVTVVLYTEWAALAGVASKAAFLCAQHAQHSMRIDQTR